MQGIVREKSNEIACVSCGAAAGGELPEGKSDCLVPPYVVYCAQETYQRMRMAEWIVYAVVSALLTGLMPSFLKTGIKKAAPALGAALFSSVVLLFAAGVVAMEARAGEILEIGNEMLLYLVLSGALQGVVWLCLSAALIHGNVNRVIPITNLHVCGALGISVWLFHTMLSVWKLCCILLLLFGTLLLESRPDKGGNGKWALFAFLALFASAAKTLTDMLYLPESVISVSVANAVRTAISTVLLWCAALLGKSLNSAKRITADGWIFLVLAGMAIGVAWLCDSRAALLGDSSYLLPISCTAFPVALLGARIFHKEEMPAGAMFGILLALAGMFGMLLEL